MNIHLDFVLISRDSCCVVVYSGHITAKVTYIYNASTSKALFCFNSSFACTHWLPWGCLCNLVAPGDSAWTGFIDQQPRVTHACAILSCVSQPVVTSSYFSHHYATTQKIGYLLSIILLYIEAGSGSVPRHVIGCPIDLSQFELPGPDPATSPETRKDETILLSSYIRCLCWW